MIKKSKKRGRKPGVKVGPYRKKIQLDADINKLTSELSDKIKERIKRLQILLKRIK